MVPMIGKTRKAAEREAHARYEQRMIAEARYSQDEIAAAIVAMYPEAAPHAATFARKLTCSAFFRPESTRTLAPSVGSDEGLAIFERMQDLMSAHIRAKKARRPKPADLAASEEYEALRSRLSTESFQWMTIWLMLNQRADDANESAAAKRRAKVEADLAAAGAKVGDEVEFYAYSGIPTIPAVHHKGRIRIRKDGVGYVACGRQRLSLYGNPWQRVTA